MSTPQVQEEHVFFEKRAKAIEEQVRQNAALVAAITKARQRPLGDATEAKDLLEPPEWK